MLFRTNTGSAFHFIAWLAIVMAAIQAWDIDQRLLAGLCGGAAILLSIAWWWEDRALRRIRSQTEMLERTRRSIESFVPDASTPPKSPGGEATPKV
jgi:hypothetical protein